MLVSRTRRIAQDHVPRAWHMFDANGQVLGRLASHISRLLMGKNKPTWDPRSNCGDHVVVYNAEKVMMTGNKWNDKLYRHHTGYPGGLREVPANKMLEKHPDRVLKKAVYGMLPPNRLRNERIKLLKIVIGSSHSFDEKFQPEDFIKTTE